MNNKIPTPNGIHMQRKFPQEEVLLIQGDSPMKGRKQVWMGFLLEEGKGSAN